MGVLAGAHTNASGLPMCSLFVLNSAHEGAHMNIDYIRSEIEHMRRGGLPPGTRGPGARRFLPATLRYLGQLGHPGRDMGHRPLRIVDARTFGVGMGDPESDVKAARYVHPKGAKVVTGARQTGVKITTLPD
jgi:hypothetical protein